MKWSTTAHDRLPVENLCMSAMNHLAYVNTIMYLMVISFTDGRHVGFLGRLQWNGKKEDCLPRAEVLR